MNNGNYGGAVVLATDTNPETSYNLVATTRLNLKNKPTLNDFENAEALVCNFGKWQEKVDVTWYMPDLYHKDYSKTYELVGKITVDIEYETNNHDGKGYLFTPSWTAGWSMNNAPTDTVNLFSTITQGFPSGNSFGIRFGLGISPFKKYKNWEFGAYFNYQFKHSLTWDEEVEFVNVSQNTYEYHHAILKDKADYFNFHIKYTFFNSK